MSKAPVLDLLLHELALAAPAGYAVGLHIRYVSPMIMVNTYPDPWQEVYTSKLYGCATRHWPGVSATLALEALE
jgi:LuxR family transcriptional regulator